METIEVHGTFHPERILEHYKYLLAVLPTGKDNKISKDDLYLKYKNGVQVFDEDYRKGTKKPMKETNFQRITRKLCEEARNAGHKVIYSTERNNSGIWICKDEAEYAEFREMQITKIKKRVQEIANMEKKAVKEVVSEIFAGIKKKQNSLQSGNLFDGVEIV